MLRLAVLSNSDCGLPAAAIPSKITSLPLLFPFLLCTFGLALLATAHLVDFNNYESPHVHEPFTLFMTWIAHQAGNNKEFVTFIFLITAVMQIGDNNIQQQPGTILRLHKSKQRRKTWVAGRQKQSNKNNDTRCSRRQHNEQRHNERQATSKSRRPTGELDPNGSCRYLWALHMCTCEIVMTTHQLSVVILVYASCHCCQDIRNDIYAHVLKYSFFYLSGPIYGKLIWTNFRRLSVMICSELYPLNSYCSVHNRIFDVADLC